MSFTYTIDDFLEILPPLKHGQHGHNTVPKAASVFWIEELMKGVSEGVKTIHADGRNHAGIRLGGYFIKSHSLGIVRAILENWNLRNTPPLESDELDHVLRNANRYSPSEQKLDALLSDYNQWCREQVGNADFEALGESEKVKLFKQSRKDRQG